VALTLIYRMFSTLVSWMVLRPRADTAKERFRMLPSARARMAVAEVARRVMRGAD
jgi:hypothetical protein